MVKMLHTYIYFSILAGNVKLFFAPLYQYHMQPFDVSESLILYHFLMKKIRKRFALFLSDGVRTTNSINDGGFLF